MKKVLALIFSALLTVVVLSACGNSSSANKIAGYKAYSVNVKSIKADKDGENYTIIGTSDAPDGSKIYVTSADSSFIDYGSNAATSSDDIESWAKVKDGKFKATVDPVNLYDDDFKSGQKLSVYVFALKDFNKKVDSSYEFTKSQMKNIKGFASKNTFTITDDVANYFNSLSDNSDSDSSDDSNSSDDTSAPNPGDLSSYNTGITYDQLARNPDQYKKKKVTFTGEVAQVIDQDGVSELRLAVNGDYDNIILVDISDKALNGSRVLENDLVTVYGVSNGITSYTSTSNEPISIPSMIAVSLDDKGKASDDYGE